MKINSKVFYLTFFIVVLSLNSYSQNRRMNMADFEKRKSEYIKKEAELTDQEADKFFPIYNELSQKRFELHRTHRERMEKMKQGRTNMSNDEYKQLLENDVDIKMKEAELEKQYSEKLEKALAPAKLYRVQQAERKFIQMEVQRFRTGEDELKTE